MEQIYTLIPHTVTKSTWVLFHLLICTALFNLRKYSIVFSARTIELTVWRSPSKGLLYNPNTECILHMQDH